MKKALAILAFVVVGAVLAWHVLYPHVVLHYRLTIEVATPEGVRTGSGVLAAYYRREPELFGARGGVTGTVGEAVAVDLGARGVLFALLTSRTMQGTPGGYEPPGMLIMTLAPELLEVSPSAQKTRRVGRITGKAEVPRQYLPFLVRFADLDDPKSVAAVDPDDLAASFGSGVWLQRATIEIVDDPVTRGIENRLRWLSMPWEEQRKLLKGPRWDSSDPSYQYGLRLILRYFRQGHQSHG